jgi:hypothetical protein
MKYCPRCKVNKDLLEFGNNKRRKDGKQTWCKECDRGQKREWFHKNKEVQLARIKANDIKSSKRNQEFVFEYLSTHPCIDCGEANILTLDFDHVRGDKIANICNLIRQPCSLKKIEDEILKCDVRCRNCHMIVTAQRANYARYRWFVQRQDSNLISYEL